MTSVGHLETTTIKQQLLHRLNRYGSLIRLLLTSLQTIPAPGAAGWHQAVPASSSSGSALAINLALQLLAPTFSTLQAAPHETTTTPLAQGRHDSKPSISSTEWASFSPSESRVKLITNVSLEEEERQERELDLAIKSLSSTTTTSATTSSTTTSSAPSTIMRLILLADLSLLRALNRRMYTPISIVGTHRSRRG